MTVTVARARLGEHRTAVLYAVLYLSGQYSSTTVALALALPGTVLCRDVNNVAGRSGIGFFPFLEGPF